MIFNVAADRKYCISFSSCSLSEVSTYKSSGFINLIPAFELISLQTLYQPGLLRAE